MFRLDSFGGRVRTGLVFAFDVFSFISLLLSIKNNIFAVDMKRFAT